jgi:hypothetical protein
MLGQKSSDENPTSGPRSEEKEDCCRERELMLLILEFRESWS